MLMAVIPTYLNHIHHVLGPIGADGGLEFGTLRVHEEIKQAMSLKNRGKYEIGYK